MFIIPSNILDYTHNIIDHVFFEDVIKVTNQLTLKEGDYPRGLNLIICTLKIRGLSLTHKQDLSHYCWLKNEGGCVKETGIVPQLQEPGL